MGGKSTNYSLSELQANLKKGFCYLVSHKYAKSPKEITDLNEKFDYNIPVWWWDAYVHLFVARFDGKYFLPTRFPMACTDNLAAQVNPKVTEIVFESDKSVLNSESKFSENRTVYRLLPKAATPEKIKTFDEKLFQQVVDRHREGKFFYSYESKKDAARQGCCQLYARTLIEACGVEPEVKLLPEGLSLLSWENKGVFGLK